MLLSLRFACCLWLLLCRQCSLRGLKYLLCSLSHKVGWPLLQNEMCRSFCMFACFVFFRSKVKGGRKLQRQGTVGPLTGYPCFQDMLFVLWVKSCDRNQKGQLLKLRGSLSVKLFKNMSLNSNLSLFGSLGSCLKKQSYRWTWHSELYIIRSNLGMCVVSSVMGIFVPLLSDLKLLSSIYRAWCFKEDWKP